MADAAILANLTGFYPKRGFVHPEDSSWNFVGATGPQIPSGAVYLALDAMLSESPDFQATPTQTQVEDASTISDHVTRKPIKISIHGLVTDSPIGVRGLVSAFSGQGASPSKKAHAFLQTLWSNRVPFDFVGGLGTYKQVVIAAYNPTNTAETGDALKFSLTLEQVLTVSTRTIILQAPKQAAPKKSAGSQVLSGFQPGQKAVVDATGNDLTAVVGPRLF